MKLYHDIPLTVAVRCAFGWLILTHGNPSLLDALAAFVGRLL